MHKREEKLDSTFFIVRLCHAYSKLGKYGKEGAYVKIMYACIPKVFLTFD